jgi:type II secretion system protein N
MNPVRKFIQLLLRNKSKFVLTGVATVVFLFILFPFEDLSDLVSSKVSEATQNSVYLQFDNLHVNLFPLPHLYLEQVHIETIKTPSLTAQELTITPSWSSLIAQKPYGQINAHGFLKGDLELKLNKGQKTESGLERQRIDVKAEKISLKDVRELAQLPIMIKGQLNLTGSALADLSFQEQPEVDLNLNIVNLELPPGTLNTALGPVNLPELKLAQIELKGRLVGGQFIIEEGKIGQSSDEAYGTVRGKMAVNIQGPSMTPQLGAYSFDIDLTVKKSFQDRASLFLSFIDAQKKSMGDRSQYRFRISAPGLGLTPSIGALQ